ncbi:MAG: hypothetical protein Q4A43_01015 [Coriobacteriia bacterium]|nr:hypothetical protein [Coriobacteriia bacterium]
MASIQDIFLAGLGALSVTNEKAKETLDKLIEQGQVSLEQGKVFSEELQHKAKDASKDAAAQAKSAAGDVSAMAGDALTSAASRAAGMVTPIEELGIEARMKAMSPEDRAAFVAKICAIAVNIETAQAEVAEAEVCDDSAAAADAPTADASKEA